MPNKKNIFLIPFVIASIFFVTCNVNEPENKIKDKINLPDISPRITYVSLDPQLQSPKSLNDPPETGWPASGQQVTWKAHVFNNNSFKITDLKYKWFVNNILFKTDSTELPQGESEINFQKEWNPQNEQIKVQIEIENNGGGKFVDSLRISSKALTIGFWVDQNIYDYVNSNPDVPGFELWARGQVERWTEILKKTTLLSKSNSLTVKDDIRIDRITVLPTGAAYPKVTNTDLIWYFTSTNSDNRFLNVGSPISVINDQTIVLHELLHQRGLIDIYAYQVLNNGPNNSNIQIKDPDGNLALDNEEFQPLYHSNGYSVVYDPVFANTVLMGKNYHNTALLSKQSIYGLNLFAEIRTPRTFDQFGNVIDVLADNNPYAAQVPDKTELDITDENNKPLKNVFIDFFFDKGTEVYQDVYNAGPDFILETDTSGIAVLTSAPWQNESWYKRYSANVIILRARYPGNSTWAYQFLPVYYMNLKYIDGDKRSARIKVTFNLK